MLTTLDYEKSIKTIRENLTLLHKITMRDNQNNFALIDDMAGFSSAHANIGKSLVEAEIWTKKDIQKAHELNIIYKRQVDISNIGDIKELLQHVPSDLDKDVRRIVTIDKTVGNTIVFQFDYDMPLINRLKNDVKGRYYDVMTKTWRVRDLNIDKVNSIKEFYKNNDFLITPSAKYLLDSIIQDDVISNTSEKVKRPIGKVELIDFYEQGKAIFITFEFSHEILNKIHDIQVIRLFKTINSSKGWVFRLSDIEQAEGDFHQDNFNTFIKKVRKISEEHNITITPEVEQLFQEKYDVNIVDTKLDKVIELDPNLLLRTLRPFQETGVKYILERKNVLLGDVVGCIDGDALISINKNRCGKKIKLRDLYQKFNGLAGKWKSNEVYARSLVGDYLQLNKILGVYFKGYKQVLQISLQDGKTLRMTPDHKVRTTDGWVEAKDLKLGDEVYTNGKSICKFCGTDKDIITYAYSKFLGYCKTCMYRNLRNNNVSTTKYLSTTDGYVYVTANLMYHPNKPYTQGMSEHRLIMEASLNGVTYEKWLEIIKYNKFDENTIFLDKDLEVHHINGIKNDNRLENLKLLTSSEHHKEHKSYEKFPESKYKLSKIVSIEDAGFTDVYDMTVENAHNFVANGIIVHNCGKTIQAIASIINSKVAKALIIVPNTLKYNWMKEWKETSDNHFVTMIKANSKEHKIDWNADIIIINYDLVDKWYKQLSKIKFEFIILDESHYIKNVKTKRTQNIIKLFDEINPEYRLLMSGTAVTNRPKELIPQLKCLGVFHKFASKDIFFLKRYCGAVKTSFGLNSDGATNLDELYNKLIQICYLRRETKDVLKDLPEKQRNICYIDIDNRKEYDLAEYDLLNYLAEWKQYDKKQLGKVERAEHLVKIEHLKQILAKGKLNQSIQWTKDFLETGEKLVLFIHHKEIAEELLKEFPEALSILSSTSIDDRNKAVWEFQNNPDKKLIICSIKCASVGLTLTASSNLAFLELLWTPADHEQAEGRIYRISQVNNCNFYYILGKDTIEETDIYPLIESKREVCNAITRGMAEDDMETNIMPDLLNKWCNRKNL